MMREHLLLNVLRTFVSVTLRRNFRVAFTAVATAGTVNQTVSSATDTTIL